MYALRTNTIMWNCIQSTLATALGGQAIHFCALVQYFTRRSSPDSNTGGIRTRCCASPCEVPQIATREESVNAVSDCTILTKPGATGSRYCSDTLSGERTLGCRQQLHSTSSLERPRQQTRLALTRRCGMLHLLTSLRLREACIRKMASVDLTGEQFLLVYLVDIVFFLFKTAVVAHHYGPAGTTVIYVPSAHHNRGTGTTSLDQRLQSNIHRRGNNTKYSETNTSFSRPLKKGGPVTMDRRLLGRLKHEARAHAHCLPINLCGVLDNGQVS